MPGKVNVWDNGRAAGESLTLGAPGAPRLSAFLARPNYSAASGAGRHGVVLAHGFPEAGQKSGSPSYGYPQLATRLAAETGAVVLTFDFRGAGGSEGDFSLTGWQSDLASAVETLRAVPGIAMVWLVGFAAGGTLAICAAGEDPGIAGVAAFAPQADFAERGGDPRRIVALARASGIIHTRGFPADPAAWARELRDLRPALLVGRIPPRPLLIVHGANDDVVPLTDARELADAANASAELRVLAGAGHGLLHDPRAIALLLGWFDRHLGNQTPGPAAVPVGGTGSPGAAPLK
ncbi:MAG TPA: alpha/beta fold hydrolase [Acidimicrobiales bacterium]|nr:alpha/beta fold hydrolase [Acidimicrobiales bacterium]